MSRVSGEPETTESAEFRAMAEELTNSEVAPPSRTALLAVAGIVGVLLAGTVVLWAHYGTAVFFETIRAGLIACFG
jgi:uncharacterized protein involved in exopolysaccharide biosynthesis